MIKLTYRSFSDRRRRRGARRRRRRREEAFFGRHRINNGH